ncbi:MAG: transposase, partial [Ktedonobacteraceae bacterium]
GLVRRHYEVGQQATRIKNQLTAIWDELFPECTEILRNPNGLIALLLREHFPTPALIAAASLEDLKGIRRGHRPSQSDLEKLQGLAKHSIGITDPARSYTLLLEQTQLIQVFHLLQQQETELRAAIERIVTGCREGQILLSMPVMGPIHAATILASIGNIRNFAKRSELRRFCGCAPRSTQTGTSIDHDRMSSTGVRLLRQTFFLLVCSSVSAHRDNAWSRLYHRLVIKKCSFDARKGVYLGKKRVIGRLAGQMCGVVHTLLKQDAEAVDAARAHGLPLPGVQLYDPDTHAGTGSGSKPLTNPAASEKIDAANVGTI